MIRIRNGSPGQRAGKKVQLRRRKSFEEEMVDHGIIGDLQEMGRFNYVIMCRSGADYLDNNSINSLE